MKRLFKGKPVHLEYDEWYSESGCSLTSIYNLAELLDTENWEDINVYEEEQKAWIKENGITVGSTVEIFLGDRIPDDWENSWIPEMNEYIGLVMEITSIAPSGIAFDKGLVGPVLRFPYTTLRKVDTPMPEYNVVYVSKHGDAQINSRTLKGRKFVHIFGEKLTLENFWKKWSIA